jgi:hypothetical protein
MNRREEMRRDEKRTSRKTKELRTFLSEPRSTTLGLVFDLVA